MKTSNQGEYIQISLVIHTRNNAPTIMIDVSGYSSIRMSENKYCIFSVLGG